MPQQDSRVHQRLENFKKALKQYESGLSPTMSRLEEEGLIQRFEYTFELAWKCLQDVLTQKGYAEIRGPRPSIEKAFQDGLITDGIIWMDMLKARNEVTHLYDEATFLRISADVKSRFLATLQKFRTEFKP